MRKLQIKDPEETRSLIAYEINRNVDARYYHRLHSVLLVASGHSCRQVGLLFGDDPTTVQRWVNQFAEGGMSGLRERIRLGRQSLLQLAQWQRLEVDLRRSPRAFGWETSSWDGPLLAKHLRLHYGVALGLRQCQRLFRQFRLRPS